jgi:hypothetical protein
MPTKPKINGLRAWQAFLRIAVAVLLITSTGIFACVLQAAELCVKSDTKLSLELVTPLNTATARVWDIVWLNVRSAVSVDGRIAIPAGTHVKAKLISFNQGQRPDLQIQLSEILFDDGRTLKLSAAVLKFNGVKNSASSGGVLVQNMAGGVLNGIIRCVGRGSKNMAVGTALAVLSAFKQPSTTRPSDFEIPAGWPFETALEHDLDISDPPK